MARYAKSELDTPGVDWLWYEITTENLKLRARLRDEKARKFAPEMFLFIFFSS